MGDKRGVDSFIHLLESHVPLWEGGDQMRWKLKRSGVLEFVFFVKHYGVHPLCLHLEGYMGVKNSSEISFFVWTAAWGKILVKTFSRGVTLLWVGVICAKVVDGRWTIFCYIVMWHLSCGVLSLDPLGFNGY